MRSLLTSTPASCGPILKVRSLPFCRTPSHWQSISSFQVVLTSILVSEWWYLIILVLATALGCTGLAVWPTWTSPAVPLYGIALCLVFIVPVGIVTAMTGVPVSLNVLAEFFGGLMAEGNALALNFFKCYGYVTCQQTITFSNDLKLAHYLKVSLPPFELCSSGNCWVEC